MSDDTSERGEEIGIGRPQTAGQAVRAGGLIEAIARAQAAFPSIVKSHTAKVPTKSGSEYSYSYANLADTLAAVIPGLSAEGIALLQPIIHTSDGVELQTHLCGHGDRITSSMPLRLDGLKPQEIGSLISYYRRYQLTSLLALAADDDDGKAAQEAKPKGRTSTKVRNPEAAVPEGEPLSFDQLVTIKDFFEAILDDEARAKSKQAFAKEFGTPQTARRDQWEAIEAWIGQ